MQRPATRLALVWSLGSVMVALAGIALILLLTDLQAYQGSCEGSLLPFLGDPRPRACSFVEYFEGHGLFTLRVLLGTLWPIAMLFVVLAVAFGLARDRQRAASPAGDAPDGRHGS